MMYPVSDLVSQLNAGDILEIACFNEFKDKKSQILKQQNLASEEGDEKLME